MAATNLQLEGSRLGLSSSEKMKSRSPRIRETMATMKSPIIITGSSSRDINPRDKVDTRISHMDRIIIKEKVGLKCLLTSTSSSNSNINSQDVRMREAPLSKCSRTKGDRWASAGGSSCHHPRLTRVRTKVTADSIQANPL
jgi:hypothetical protein